MGYPRNEDFLVKYDYDFSEDGGAVGAITLNADVNSLGQGVIVKRLRIITKTALASAGSPTVTLGNTTDPDGYFVDFYALANAAGNVINSSAVAGALIWDDTNDHEIYYSIDSTAANQNLLLTIGTAALTAGKLEIYLECGFDPEK